MTNQYYPNLEAEKSRRGLTNKNLQQSIKCKSIKTVNNKLSGKTSLTLPEAMRIQKKWFSNCTLEYLYARDIKYEN